MGPKRAKLAEDAEKDAEMDEEVSDESTDSEDEKMDEDEATNDDQPEGMEQLDFDFEALPPDAKDINQIGNLLTQIFLRTDIDFDGLSQAIVDQAPVGCVILPTEDCVDEDNDDTVYGVSSVVPLSAEKNFGVGELLTQRAKKYADKNVAQTLAKLFGKNSTTKLGLLINERMLHFPAQISGKALEALKNDIQSNASLNEIETFVVILKMRFSEEGVKADGPSNSKVKPKGKAAKKRARASKLEATEALFDNEEEELLFEAMDSEFSYFQYPVHFDVESKSKFHVIRRNGVVYQPYRRVNMRKLLSLIGLLVLLGVAFGSPAENKTWKNEVISPNATTDESLAINGAQCYDYRLSNFINTGLQYYSHNMGQLATYILDQIKRGGMGNFWLVNAEMIQNRRQGLDWQTLTNGDLFASSSRHGCYYHDTQTFIFIVRY